IQFFSIRIRNAFDGSTRKLLNSIRKKQGPLYLNLGSGPRGLDDVRWINIDGFRDKNVQYLCDFNRRLPFDDETFDGIFCEHVLEHFSYENGRKVLEECKRIMKQGG